MKWLRFVPAFAAVVVCAALAAQAAPKRTLVRAGHVVDVKTGHVSDAQTIIVVGDKIQTIVPTAETPVQAGDAVVDVSGLTLLPGLMVLDALKAALLTMRA